jgi:acetyl-CoA carboxylase carboxyltransferase component
LTAVERVISLLDPSSFRDVDSIASGEAAAGGQTEMQATDGVIAGGGRIGGREVVVFAHDRTYLGGSMGKGSVEKTRRAVGAAVGRGVPLIGLIDSAGARVQEGVQSMSEIGGLVKSMFEASGSIPQIFAVMGTSVGGASYSSAMSDFVIMVERNAQLLVWGPGLVKAETGLQATAEELGGYGVHTRNGVCALSAKDEAECFRQIRALLAYLPQNCAEDPPVMSSFGHGDPSIAPPMPDLSQPGHDPRALVGAIFDPNSFLELHGGFAQNVLAGFARLGGRPVGIVASQPLHLNGYLDLDASDKICRFVRTCDCFNVPVVTFVDSPGFLPGPEQERLGLIRHGAKLMFAYAEASIPKVAVIVGKAYGGAVTGLCSKPLGQDYVMAYPSAEIQVMSFRSHEETFRKSPIPSPPDRDELLARYTDAGDPRRAASLGYLDLVVRPEETRSQLTAVLDGLRGRRPTAKKVRHSNMPV